MGDGQTGDSIRAALEGAWEASTGGEESSPSVEAPQVEETKDETPAAPVEQDGEQLQADEKAPDSVDKSPPADRPRDESGKFTKAPKPPKKTAAPATGEQPTPSKPAAGAPSPPSKPPLAGEQTATKPPAGWKPLEREAWAKVPAEAQAAVARREREFAVTMQELAPHRQTSETFQKIVSPYIGMLQAEGGDPMATTASLFQTWAALRTAPPVAKAQLVANIISTFGVDPGHVAAHLQGQPPQQQGPQFDPNQFAQQIEQRVASRFEQQQQQALNAHHATRWAKFADEHEYAEQLSPHMAKLIEAGLADDFEDAYNKAAALDPEVSRVLAQRDAVTRANASRASTQRKIAASTSLKSSPAGPTAVAPQSNDRRSAVERAYDQVLGTRR